MQTITLYRYEREGGGITVSPVKPDVEYTGLYRLVADEGKLLTQDGEQLYPCVDVESIDGWYEVDEPDAEAVDPAELNRTYTETDELIPVEEEMEEM